MTVFKAFLKILSKNKIAVGVNLAIALGISILMTTNPVLEDSVMEVVRVGIIQNHESEMIDGLLTHLDDIFTIVEVEDDEAQIKLDLFYMHAHYILIINEDGFQAYQAPSSNVGHLVENTINNYLNTFRLIESANPDMDISEIISGTIENINIEADVYIEISDESINNLRNFFNMYVYGGLRKYRNGNWYCNDSV